MRYTTGSPESRRVITLYDLLTPRPSISVGGVFISKKGKGMFRGIKFLAFLFCSLFFVAAGATVAYAESEFTITTTPNTKSFKIKISAAGTFIVDWGDGRIETIEKPDVSSSSYRLYSHTYSTAGTYNIGISGQATAYSTDVSYASISFSTYTNIAGISGSLGAVFGTLADGTQPRFNSTFHGCTNLKSISENLFSGISGAPAERMFQNTFYGCTGLTSIPENLFSTISGAPTLLMFGGTFQDCTGLTSIPKNLFSTISGTAANGMFHQTFNGCSGLTGYVDGAMFPIPAGSADWPYSNTFYGATSMDRVCPSGTYAVPKPDADWGVAVCSPCPESHPLSGVDATSINMCYNNSTPARCSSGQYYNADESKCVACAPNSYCTGETGTYYDGTISELIACPEYKESPQGSDSVDDCVAPAPEFTITTTADTSSFSVSFDARGLFYIDWGDGNVEQIVQDRVYGGTISHTYATAGAYNIGLSGQATGYNVPRCWDSGCSYSSTISFEDNSNKKVAAISGSLGAIFGTLSDGTQPVFAGAFRECTNLKGSIPADLFQGVYGTPGMFLFSGTFEGCTGLTGEIPAGLFSGLSGAPARSVFSGTFEGCAGLTGEIPAGLFAGISGAAADFMFYKTFYGCSGLTGYVDGAMFPIPAGSVASPYYNAFVNATSMDTSCPEGTYAVDKPDSRWTVAVCSPCPSTHPSSDAGASSINMCYNASASQCGVGQYYNAPADECMTCPANSYCPGEIKTYYGGTVSDVMACLGGTSPAGSTSEDDCVFVPEFTVATVAGTTSFNFKISAAGTFYVDWGDGSEIQIITKSDTTNTTYSHTYSDAGTYNIGISGQATKYNTDEYTAAISFYNNTNVAGISGSLGAIFGTLTDGTNPRFYDTFYNCTGLTGNIPSDLFSGISGAPAERMFNYTFERCSGLTGTVPAGLFSGLSGAAADYMFNNTFSGCSGLTGYVDSETFTIPAGSAFNPYVNTFNGASSMDVVCPSDMYNATKPDDDWTVAVCGSCPETHPYFDSSTTSINMCYMELSESCDAGQYYDTNTSQCTICPANSYCMGGNKKVYYDGTVVFAPATPCPMDGISPAGSTSQSDCDFTFVSEFTVTTTSTSSFSFNMAAAGSFVINWGDGNYETITSNDSTDTKYSHTYSTPGVYNIEMLGQATEYDTLDLAPAISFAENEYVAGISGSLGAIFGTLDDGTQPIFAGTFSRCSNLTGEIPANLFAGIQGAPAEGMFSETFAGTGITSIPADLFKGISGAPAVGMFYNTFAACMGVTSIPAGLFSGIKGAPALAMYAGVFGMTGIKSIPDGLFSGIKGAPAEGMFAYAFAFCTELTSVPTDLFAGISGAPAAEMFFNTFAECSNWTGRLSSGFFGKLSGAPAAGMFTGTFMNCSGLTGRLPADLFGDLSGDAADEMFNGTFAGCSGLTGYVDGDMFTVPSGDAFAPYDDIFAGATSMDTICPANTYGRSSPDALGDSGGVAPVSLYSVSEPEPDYGYTNNWPVAICSRCPEGSSSPEGSSRCDSCGDGWGVNSWGGCNRLCASGITKLRTSTGVSIPLFAEQNTSPSIFVLNNGGDVCYADLVEGEEDYSINVDYNGMTYHTHMGYQEQSEQ